MLSPDIGGGIPTLVSGVQKLLQQAKSKLKPPLTAEDSLTASLIDQYLQGLKDEPINREKEANFILSYADECYQAKRYAEALDGFLTLRYRFANTQLYNRNEEGIKNKISICQRNTSQPR